MSLPLALLLVAALPLLPLAAIHLGFRAPRRPEHSHPRDHGLAGDEVWIPTEAGKRLFGWWLPAPGADSTLLLLHGWGGNLELMLPLALPFHRAGLNLLLIDARNHGRSDRHGHSSLPRFAEDTERAIDWLRRRHPDASHRLALLGHSVGAGAVLLAASRRRDVDAVISVAAFAHPEWMMRRYLDRPWLPRPLGRLVLRYVEWVIGHRFDAIAPLHTVCRIPCPVLLVHGSDDRTVPLADARAIAAACPSSRIRLLVIPGADHDSVQKVEEHGAALVRFLTEAGAFHDSARPVGGQQAGNHPDATGNVGPG